MNYHALTTAQKTALKPLVSEIRKNLYGTTTNAALLKGEGLVINFGKRAEARYTVKIQIVA